MKEVKRIAVFREYQVDGQGYFVITDTTGNRIHDVKCRFVTEDNFVHGGLDPGPFVASTDSPVRDLIPGVGELDDWAVVALAISKMHSPLTDEHRRVPRIGLEARQSKQRSPYTNADEFTEQLVWVVPMSSLFVKMRDSVADVASMIVFRNTSWKSLSSMNKMGGRVQFDTGVDKALGGCILES